MSKLSDNVLQLGEVAEIEAQMFSFVQMFNRRLPLNLALNPPFCQTAVVKSVFKTLKNTRMKSMLKWIITNKQMSLSRKIYKSSVYLICQFASYFRKGSQCTLICAVYGHQPLFYKKLFRRIELLKKKGYIVRLELSLSEKQLSLLDSESAMLLTQSINLLKQQKESIWI